MESTWFLIMVYCCCMAATCLTLAAAQTNISTDQSALLALKDRITSDPHNLISTNWSATTPVCNWVGVTCCTRHHRVAVLNLSYMELTGTIPPELGNLSFLVELRFRNNSFHGSLPQELARLRRLKLLGLSFNKLMGVIPSWFGSLSKLQSLYLYGNKFSGSIPAAIFNLSALQVISLSYNQLSGRLPREIGNLTTLKEIYLDGNNYKEIPSEIGGLDQLEMLFVQENALEGNVPMFVFNMSSLITLALYGNHLKGRLPDNMCQNIPHIQKLNIGQNQLEGPLPSIYWHCKKLVTLSLSENNFIVVYHLNKLNNKVSWFGSLSKLQTLSLYGNKFSGSIPAAIFNLSALQVINLSYNQLSGRIPREIGNLTTLKEIYLDGNNYKEIPSEIGGLDQLEMLFVQENALEGNVPMFVFNMSSLITLALYGNHLKGRLPDNMCQNIPHIQVLNIGQNQLEGPLPSIYWHCKKLVTLKLRENNFSGSVPKNIGNATQLTIVDLSENNFTAGTIPDEIGRLPNLVILDLSANNLNGLIPTSIFNKSTITILDLSGNQLSGNLPQSIGLGLPNLQMFFIGGNYLSGVIPISISNATQLTVLELAQNFLSGYIPSTLFALTNLEKLSLFDNNLIAGVNIFSCLENLKKLKYLNFGINPLNTSLPISLRNISTSLQKVYLYSCNMRGNIPADIGNLSSLTVLIMFDNNLSGSIPTSIGTLKNLEGLSLAGNELQRHIPVELCQLQHLVILWLDGNHLSGSIPSCLGQFTALRTLSLGSNLLNSTIPSTLWGLSDLLKVNLSSNNLSGFLSEDVGNLKAVIELDLSNNRLSGSIPTSIGNLQTLLNLSLANNKFEGLIPTSLGKSLSLELLDLSNNSLTGMIPKSLESLKYLKSLNLSFNMLYGEIPTGGPFQNFYAQSFVSSGKLCGASRFSVPACKNSIFEAHSSKSSRSKLKYIIPGILLALFMVTFIWIVILRRRKNVKAATETAFLPQHLWRRVSHLELVRATNAFDESNLLGSGGFGSVYKGTLSDGMDVAIKVFNLQLEVAFKSFDIECEMLGNIRHRNLIKIISCCSQIDFKAVVLNYMPNGSLEKWLYSQNLCLNILQRLSIMIDVASALEYLHHGYGTPIVHCDLKPSNILLDENMSAHVADFGIAKLLCGGDSMTQTITQATVGYMAPEYGMEGIVTTRGDVYSFGIVLMETFTGKKPTDEMFVGEMSLKQWVANSALFDVVDANLQVTEADNHDFVNKYCECLSSIIRLALACSADSPEERVYMQDVLATLNKIKVKFLKDATRGRVLNPSLV